MIFTFYVKAVCAHVDGHRTIDFPPAPSMVLVIEAPNKDEARDRILAAVRAIAESKP